MHAEIIASLQDRVSPAVVILIERIGDRREYSFT